MTNLFSLKNKTAIVTGALGLLGKKHCEALASAGANVVVADINESAAQSFAASFGENHLGIGTDVTSEGSLKTVKDKILARYRTIDVLVNNAAINDMFENPGMAKELSAFENYPLDAFKNHWM